MDPAARTRDLTPEDLDGAVRELAMARGVPPYTIREMAADAAGVASGCTAERWEVAGGLAQLAAGRAGTAALPGVPDPWTGVDLSRADLDIPEAAVEYYTQMQRDMQRRERKRFHGRAGSGKPVTSRSRAHHGDLERDPGDWSGPPPTVGPTGVYGGVLGIRGVSAEALDSPEIARMFQRRARGRRLDHDGEPQRW